MTAGSAQTMTDIIEKAARAAFDELGRQNAEAGEDCWIGDGTALARAVIRSLRDNTDSPRVCDELTRMLGEEG